MTEELPETTIRRLTQALDKIHRYAVATSGSGGAGKILEVLKDTQGYEAPKYETCERCHNNPALYVETKEPYDFFCDSCK